MKASSFKHLLVNLGRLNCDNIFYGNCFSDNWFPGFSKGDYSVWLSECISANTRLIIEPKIDGCSLALVYENGTLKAAIAADGSNKTTQLYECRNLPKNIPFKRMVRIQGLIYAKGLTAGLSRTVSSAFLDEQCPYDVNIRFVGLQIFNVNLNQYSQLKELAKLGFQIPPNDFTRRNTSEVKLYISLWKAKKLFCEVPSTGLVLKVNSRKLQKQLGESNSCLNWAYLIEDKGG